MKKRNSNYELMRIISMFLIVLYHTIHHGLTIDLAVNPYCKMILEVLRLVTLVHVNSFILATGFFQSNSKFRFSKVLDLVLLSFFYKLIIILAFSKFNLLEFSNMQLIKEFFPLDLLHNWYFKYYIILYFLTPFINKGLNILNKKSFTKLVFVMIFFFSIIPVITNGAGLENGGYNLYQFLFMYVLGAYLRKYPINENYKISKWKYRFLLIFIIIFCVALNFFAYKYSFKLQGSNEVISELMWYYQNFYMAYNNIIVVVQSISYFLFFGTFNFSSKIVNHVSKMMFGIYLIHDNNYIRANIYNWMNISNDLIYSFRYFLYVIWIAIIIFVSCYIIESIRYFVCYIFKKIINYKEIENKLNSFQLCDED